MDFKLQLIGERRVALRFVKFPEIARKKLLEVVTDYQAQLESAIRAKLPQGRTGAIKAALAGGVENNQYKLRGWVSLAGGNRKTVILPALALEYGTNRAIKVKAHEDRLLKTVYGRYINPMLVDVDEYNRTTDIVAQRFLRDPLDSLARPAIDAMEAALAQAIKESDA